MPAKPAVNRYDWLSILLHWFIAIAVIGLFASGLWMVDLGYYDDWYYQAPFWHKGIGIIAGSLIVLRWLWSLFRPSLPLIPNSAWQHLAAKIAHQLMNIAVLLLVISGYVMVTAKGDGLNVFDWFSIPAIVNSKSHWVDPAGSVHLWTGYFIIALASLHALAALKHHLIDKDGTLKRMIGINSGEKQ